LLATDKTTEPPGQISHASIAFSLNNTKCGSLKTVIDIFYNHNLNMSKLESRPTGAGLGDYVFYIDLESKDSSSIKNALKQIKPLCERFVNYGSYLTTIV